MASFEPCGCTSWIAVLGYDDVGTYREAASQTRRGFVVREVDVDEWKARGLWCELHPDGPPWWKSHGGNGKRPTEFTLQQGLGL